MKRLGLPQFLAFFQKRALMAIFKNSAEGVLIISRNGLVEWANQTVKTKTELEGKYIADIIGQNHVWPPRTNEPIRRHIASSFVEYITTPLKNGYLVTVRELNAKNGIIPEMEKKHNHQLLEVEKKHTERTGQIVHDLKTPLNAIIGFSDLAIDAMEERRFIDVNEYLRQIYRIGKTMSKDIDAYLSFIRIKDGISQIKKDAINLREMGENVKHLIEVSFREKGILVDASGEAIIIADYALIKNALMNALKNAAEATAAGKHIKLEISENDNLAIIRIINIGHIPAEDFQKIFNPDITFSTKGGNGMGIPMIKMIIEAHNGQVTIANEGDKVVLTMIIPKS
ncbi:MAG: HAMP domain-containing sensor histidine kinase [Patescibacteria group bacterium]|nr:HAMP domain-containing sensor histidine kinase [Patescibacteria group bacterium]